MPPSLLVSGVPTNIRLPEGSRLTYCDSDMHDIASRLQDLDPALRIIVMEHVDGQAAFAICETDRSGVESLIMRVGPGCKIDALDGRVIDHINWIRRVPVNQRAAQLERELAAEKLAREEAAREKLYNDMGEGMYRKLHECGFISTPRPESYKPLNKTARRAGRRI